MERGVQFVVGITELIIDHLKRGTLNLAPVRVVVLDEAHRMLDMSFIEDLEYVLSKVPINGRTSLFSATIDQRVMNVRDRNMKKPEKIPVNKDEIVS